MKNLILTVFLFPLFGCLQQEAKVTPPNIIFILADDIGQTQLGCYGGPYHTPFIDDFATQGMQFTQAYFLANYLEYFCTKCIIPEMHRF